MKKRQFPLGLFLVLVISYLLISFFLPLNEATREAYNLNISQARILAFLGILPVFGVWFAALFGWNLLRKYADAIKRSNEGKAFKKIADGVMILTLGLIVRSFSSLILTGISSAYWDFHPASVILQNYITLIFPLVAFWLILTGSRQLLNNSGGSVHIDANESAKRTRLLTFIFAIIAVAYSYSVFSLNGIGNTNSYFLPTFLLLLTIVIPYLFTWFSGLNAALDLTMHAKLTKGHLYRRSLNSLAAGLITLIVASIILQFLNSLFIASLGMISINFVLLIDYLLLFVMVMGYLLLAFGTRGLTRIEEV